jgi:hypothetical protein
VFTKGNRKEAEPSTSTGSQTRLSELEDHDVLMKAIVRDTYGSHDVLELRDIGRPEIGDDEVLVRVHAAGVDRGGTW